MKLLSSQENGRESTPAEPGPDSGRGTTVAQRVLSNAAHLMCAIKSVLRTDVGNFEREITYRAGAEMLHCYLRRECCGPGPKESRAFFEQLMERFAEDGLCTFTVRTFDESRMFIEVSCPDSNEAMGFLSHDDMQERPACSFAAGLLAATGKTVFRSSACDGPDEIVATETACASCGGGVCTFLVGRRADLERLGHHVGHMKESISEHALRLNDEIFLKNLELQNLNLDLERQVRKRTEDLKRSEEDYRSLVNLSPDPIIICHMDGTIKSANESALNMLEYGPGDHLESENISMILLDGTNAWERCTWLVNKEGILRNQEFGFVKRKGGKIVGEVSARIANLHPEKMVHLVIRDVTERNLLRTRMEQAKGESDFFNDLLSHDIVNYMSAAMHFLDKLQTSKGLAPEDMKDLGIVAKDVRGAYELASVVRDLSRAEALGDSECRDAIDACGTVSEAVEDAKRIFAGRDVVINVTRPEETCYVEGGTLLSRLFVNLLTNAIKFDSSKTVEIDIGVEAITHKDTEYWSIRIADRGKGIVDHEKEKVFERYYRGDTNVAGTGLGLYVVRKIARACGGLVWAENRVSDDYSQGTTMVVMLRKASGHNGKHQVK